MKARQFGQLHLGPRHFAAMLEAVHFVHAELSECVAQAPPGFPDREKYAARLKDLRELMDMFDSGVRPPGGVS